MINEGGGGGGGHRQGMVDYPARGRENGIFLVLVRALGMVWSYVLRVMFVYVHYC